MSNPLQRRLAEALAASGNEKHQRLGLGHALASYLTWADSDACPSPEVAAAYLNHLAQKQDWAAAQSCFATLQIAAGYAWGARETRHLAVTLRGARVTDKPARRAAKDRLEGILERLP